MNPGSPRRGARSQRRSPEGRNPAPDDQETLTLRNRTRLRHVNLGFLRRIVRALLQQTWRDGSLDLAIYVVAAPEITRLNENFLHHKGSTDVITFDYAERAEQPSRLPGCGAPHRRSRGRRDACPTLLHGEIFVCLDEAVSQARRFRTTWQHELVRYVVHGVLHLLGYEDRHSRARRKMKSAEDTLVRQLAREFDFRRLSEAGRQGPT